MIIQTSIEETYRTMRTAELQDRRAELELEMARDKSRKTDQHCRRHIAVIDAILDRRSLWER